MVVREEGGETRMERSEEGTGEEVDSYEGDRGGVGGGHSVRLAGLPGASGSRLTNETFHDFS